MTVSWSPHRFSGGALALDVANTVVLRNDPEKTFDRFADAAEIGRFAGAASVYRAAELAGRTLHVADAAAGRARIVALREACDRFFRDAAATGSGAAALLAPVLGACAAALKGHDGRLALSGSPFGGSASPVAFEAALAISALSLLAPERLARIRICANCAWLFLDASRNGSRVWCDMAVCGNRQKAKRHYSRHRTPARENRHD